MSGEKKFVKPNELALNLALYCFVMPLKCINFTSGLYELRDPFAVVECQGLYESNWGVEKYSFSSFSFKSAVNSGTCFDLVSNICLGESVESVLFSLLFVGVALCLRGLPFLQFAFATIFFWKLYLFCVGQN